MHSSYALWVPFKRSGAFNKAVSASFSYKSLRQTFSTLYTAEGGVARFFRGWSWRTSRMICAIFLLGVLPILFLSLPCAPFALNSADSRAGRGSIALCIAGQCKTQLGPSIFPKYYIKEN